MTPHLTESSEPIRNGKYDKKTHLVGFPSNAAIDWRCTVTAMCGDDIPDPVQLAVWDQLPVGTVIDMTAVNAIGTCSKCFKRVLEVTERQTIYAVKYARALKSV